MFKKCTLYPNRYNIVDTQLSDTILKPDLTMLCIVNNSKFIRDTFFKKHTIREVVWVSKLYFCFWLVYKKHVQTTMLTTICLYLKTMIIIKVILQKNTLHNLVPFIQLKKCEKHPWRSDNFSKVAGWMKPVALLKVTFLCGCFSSFLNCTNFLLKCFAWTEKSQKFESNKFLLICSLG